MCTTGNYLGSIVLSIAWKRVCLCLCCVGKGGGFFVLTCFLKSSFVHSFLTLCAFGFTESCIRGTKVFGTFWDPTFVNCIESCVCLCVFV